MWSKVKKPKLTDADKEMYAAERLDNFRWISQLVASYSKVYLKEVDRVPSDICEQISDIGQFAEIVYSSTPLPELLPHYGVLNRTGYPLEGYTAVGDAVLERSLTGKLADLPAAVFWRPSLSQVVVSVCGTKSPAQALQDVRAVKTKHSSGKGLVHMGFWSLYQGLKLQLRAALCETLRKHGVDSEGASGGGVSEIVLTGHSMGGSVVYLVAMDILNDLLSCLNDKDDVHDPLMQVFKGQSTVKLKLVTFGMPRTGDQALVDYFQFLIKECGEQYGEGRFVEYAVRTYNDGVPALPPLKLGYRHFPLRPIYATGVDLYYIPKAEREKTLFHIKGQDVPTPPGRDSGEDMVGEADGIQSPSLDDSSDGTPTLFPKGGHNYYGGRELERLQRRIVWLEKAGGVGHEEGWEERYLSLARKGKAANPS